MGKNLWLSPAAEQGFSFLWRVHSQLRTAGAGKVESSPNPAQLQTEQAGNLEFESEPGSTSDTKGGESAGRVRTRSNFRQKEQEK
ncbi:hypothetical protein ABE67_21985 [Cytobacillus firmus]|nr:hypothetical protein [Cytobacillus firmus]